MFEWTQPPHRVDGPGGIFKKRGDLSPCRVRPRPLHRCRFLSLALLRGRFRYGSLGRGPIDNEAAVIQVRRNLLAFSAGVEGQQVRFGPVMGIGCDHVATAAVRRGAEPVDLSLQTRLYFEDGAT